MLTTSKSYPSAAARGKGTPVRPPAPATSRAARRNSSSSTSPSSSPSSSSALCASPASASSSSSTSSTLQPRLRSEAKSNATTAKAEPAPARSIAKGHASTRPAETSLVARRPSGSSPAVNSLKKPSSTPAAAASAKARPSLPATRPPAARPSNGRSAIPKAVGRSPRSSAAASSPPIATKSSPIPAVGPKASASRTTNNLESTTAAKTVPKAIPPSSAAAPARNAVESSLEDAVAELRQQLSARETEIALKTNLLAEKDEALTALRTAAAAGFPADPDASEYQAAVSSLRDQLAELRETKAELESHVDGLNAKIIAISDKHGREAAELRAELAASWEVRRADRLADEQCLERQTEALRFAHATIKSLAAELAAVYADRSADDVCGEPLADALRAAQATVENLEAELTVPGTDRQAWQPSRAKESQYQELLSGTAVLAEDLRLDQIKGLEEHSAKGDILTGARDAGESATAALATEAGELRSELERVKAEHQSAKAELTEQVQVLLNEKATLLDSLRSSDAAESATAALVTEAGELRSELERVKAEYQSMKAELTEQVQVLSNEKATLLDNLRSSDVAESATAALATEAAELRSELEHMKAEYQSTKAGLTEQVQVLLNEKATLLDNLRSSGSARSATAALAMEAGELRSELERVKAEYQSAKAELTEQVQVLLNEKATLLDKLRSSQEKIEASEEDHISQIDALICAREEAESSTSALETEIGELKAELERVKANFESKMTELTEQVRLLLNEKTTLLEDLRLCREGVKLSEEERSSQLDVVTRARDAAESEVAHVMAYLELVISGCERDTAAETATETVDVRSVASLLVDGVENGDVWEPSAALGRIADKFRSVHEERVELKARVEKLSAELAEAAGDGELRRAEGCRAATEEAGRLLSDNATLTAAAVVAESSHPAPQHERPGGGEVTANGLLTTDHAEKVKQLENRISELKAELETRREMEVKVQSAKDALAEAEAALATETRRATKMEKRLKCKDEQVKSLESAMAKMKPPTPPLTNAEAERLLKRELERKEVVIRDLQVRCAEVERRSGQDETAERECVTPAGDEISLREELEKKQSAIAELQTKVARVMRVHAEDVQSIKSKCRSEIAEERLRAKELLEVARKEYDHLFLRFQALQSELATAQTPHGDPAAAELPVDFS